jgi:hypothetical protein
LITGRKENTAAFSLASAILIAYENRLLDPIRPVYNVPRRCTQTRSHEEQK